MSTNSRLRYSFAVATLVGSALLGATASASAADECPVDVGNVAPLCVYDGADFTGLLDNRPVWTPNLPAERDNKISSVINETSYTALLFTDGNYQGETIEVGPGQRWVAPPEWDNRISGYVLY